MPVERMRMQSQHTHFKERCIQHQNIIRMLTYSNRPTVGFSELNHNVIFN